MSLRASGLCALVLSFVVPPTAELAYRPDTKGAWVCTFEEANEFRLETMTQRLDGNELDGPVPDMSGTITRRVVVRDEGSEAKDGRMLVRRRTFEELAAESKVHLEVLGQSQDFAVELQSELEGHELAVTWDAKTEAYGFAFVEEEAPSAALLEGLLEDLDLRALLAEDAVEEGAAWELDLADQRALLAPGGALHLVPSEAPRAGGDVLDAYDIVSVAALSLADVAQQLEGTLRVRWSETREDDEHHYAVLTLELDGRASADLSARVAAMAEAAELEPRDDLRFDVALDLEGRGELLWDLGAGHFHTLELELEGVQEIELGFAQPWGEIEVEVETSGTTKLAARAEREG